MQSIIQTDHGEDRWQAPLIQRSSYPASFGGERAFMSLYFPDVRDIITPLKPCDADAPISLRVVLQQCKNTPGETDIAMQIRGAPRDCLELLPAENNQPARADLTHETLARLTQVICNILAIPQDFGSIEMQYSFEFLSNIPGSPGYGDADFEAFVDTNLFSRITGHRIFELTDHENVEFLRPPKL